MHRQLTAALAVLATSVAVAHATIDMLVVDVGAKTIEFIETATPGISSTGRARLYASTTHELLLSVNGAAFAPAGGPLGGCVWAATGIDCVDGSSHIFDFVNTGAGALILEVDGALVWTEANDGAASQLDAAFLGGVGLSGVVQTTTMTTVSTTCAAGVGTSSLTLDPTCSQAGATVNVNLANSDADGCNVTIAKSFAMPSCTVIISVTSSAGGTITFADVTNVAKFAGGSWTPAVGSVAILVYQDLATDRYGELARSGF